MKKLIIDIPEDLYEQIYSDAEIIIYGGMRSGKTLLATLLRSIRNGTPLDKKEPTYEEVMEYCKKRHLSLVTNAFMYRLLNGGDK